MGYKNLVLKSISWMAILQVGTRVISILKFIFIARLLSPNSLGIFGISMLIVGITEIVSELGISTFLIRQNTIQKYIHTAWLLQLSRGAVLSLFLFLSSFLAPIYFDVPGLKTLLLFSTLIPLIKSFENPYLVKFYKEIEFHKEFMYRFSIVLIDFIFGVYFVFITKSPSGLILGISSAAFFGVLISWIFIKEKPSLEFNIKKITYILSFSKSVNLIGILYYVTSQIDNFTIGKFLGPTSLGYYQVAQKFSFIPMIEISDIFGKVTLPVYSKISKDSRRLRKGYLQIFTMLGILQLITMCILFFFAKEIILILVGPKWVVTENIFKFFAVYGFFASLVGTNGSLFYSLGRQNLLLRLSVVRFLVIIPLMIYGVIHFGINGVIGASFLSLLLIAPLSFYYTFKILT